MWEKVREPGENPCRRRENMQTAHRKVIGLESNPQPSCCTAAMLTTAPPWCRLYLLLFLHPSFFRGTANSTNISFDLEWTVGLCCGVEQLETQLGNWAVDQGLLSGSNHGCDWKRLIPDVLFIYSLSDEVNQLLGCFSLLMAWSSACLALYLWPVWLNALAFLFHRSSLHLSVCQTDWLRRKL